MATKIKKVCSYCGSTNILADASARWDENEQSWVIDRAHSSSGTAYCVECVREVAFKDCPVEDQ